MAFSNLRGKRLNIVLGVVGATCFALQGYDQAVANGLLTLPTWVAVFPQIDTISSGLTKAQKSHNSTLQGKCCSLFYLPTDKACWMLTPIFQVQRSPFTKSVVPSALYHAPLSETFSDGGKQSSSQDGSP